jgi:hypothetical protein
MELGTPVGTFVGTPIGTPVGEPEGDDVALVQYPPGVIPPWRQSFLSQDEYNRSRAAATRAALRECVPLRTALRIRTTRGELHGA